MVRGCRPQFLCFVAFTALINCSNPAPTRLLLVRHTGRADFAEDSWIKVGHNIHDPPVAEGAKRLARKLGGYLNGREVSRVYSSPFLRCIQTAQATADVLDLIYDILPEAGLADFLHGVLFPHAEANETIWAPLDMTKIICDFVRDEVQPIAYPMHPETLAQFCERCVLVINEIANRCEGKTTLLVTHAAVIETCVKGLVPGTSVPDIPFGSVTEVVREDFEASWRVESLADCGYQDIEGEVVDFDL